MPLGSLELGSVSWSLLLTLVPALSVAVVGVFPEFFFLSSLSLVSAVFFFQPFVVEVGFEAFAPKWGGLSPPPPAGEFPAKSKG